MTHFSKISFVRWCNQTKVLIEYNELLLKETCMKIVISDRNFQWNKYIMSQNFYWIDIRMHCWIRFISKFSCVTFCIPISVFLPRFRFPFWFPGGGVADANFWRRGGVAAANFRGRINKTACQAAVIENL